MLHSMPRQLVHNFVMSHINDQKVGIILRKFFRDIENLITIKGIYSQVNHFYRLIHFGTFLIIPEVAWETVLLSLIPQDKRCGNPLRISAVSCLPRELAV